jgi:DUF177 domain-containing protein
MPTISAFRIPVADLLRRPGATRAVREAAPLADVRGPGAEIPADRPIAVEVVLERVPEGLVVRGTITTRWEAACSRCLAPVGGDVEVGVAELYERDPLEGETYPLSDDDIVDLEPLIRDALLLELPPVPLCRPDCRGLCPRCGIDHNTSECDCADAEPDPRWAALRSLDL